MVLRLSSNKPNFGCPKSPGRLGHSKSSETSLIWLDEQPVCALSSMSRTPVHYLGLHAAERAACLLCHKVLAMLFP
jgi:hypothetical protein